MRLSTANKQILEENVNKNAFFRRNFEKPALKMAKETTIIFVYDTELLKREEDDPNSAILYFHPTWVSEQQKTALCGQIIGTMTCLKGIFSLPKIVSLQTGKFFVIENGRYLLAVGTDRNVSDWILEHRANLVNSLVTFFHKDFNNLAQTYQKDSLSAKLYHMFDTYLKMLFFGGNIFSHVPSLCLPKSGSNAFTEAITFLESCGEFSNVLGGAVLYHNKVVATQLSIETTKKLVLSDPYRIKNPAEPAETDFDLPLGVQLLQVYVTNKEFCDLLETSLRNRCIFQYLTNKSIKKSHPIKHLPTPSHDHPNPIISALKRDTSLLFTAVPEEGDAPFSAPQAFACQKKSRPKFLNLRSLSVESNESKSSARLSPITPFCGQTSVASTPMTELKRFVHQNALSLVDKKGPNVEEKPPIPDLELVKTGPKQGSSLVDLSEILGRPGRYHFLKSRPYLSPKNNAKLKRTRTIHDPFHPIFKRDGTVASRHYFEDKLRQDMVEVFVEKKPFEKSDYKPDACAKKTDAPKMDGPTLKPDQNRRNSLTLPLKPTTDRKLSGGVQLTPLMNKLTTLALEEGATKTPFGAPPPSFKAKAQERARGVLQKCALFVCGQRDVVLGLLMKEESAKDKEAVVRLWELCTEHLPKLERQLNFCLESHNSGTGPQESEPYSFLCLDSKWDTVKRGGPWGPSDLNSLALLHADFRRNGDVSEILLRSTENVIYGYRSGPSEVFYHESAPMVNGLLPPSDAIGLVQLKARRRLERDHAVVLL